ncbi:MAG: SUMF1/EgtB/PvdO family nonheme iron enzyme [Verrucomicrobiales bacterium]|nr:SUMF1/EgtB/PvdO family nonheme iron enzyme [Verrucomicrobiales bacterium]
MIRYYMSLALFLPVLALAPFPVPPPPKKLSPADRLRAATKDTQFVNSLGLEFVPLPGKPGVYMCRTETRVRDFEAFVNASGYNATGGGVTLESGRWKQAGGTWLNPRFPASCAQTGDHPVNCVSWEDSKAFCAWLSGKTEEKELSYRLPSDSEWSSAAGVGRYPWGSQFPPPANVGNYAGKEANIGGWSNNRTISNFNDGSPRTARVGSYLENRFGFFDLGGNVFEWCEDRHRSWMNDADVDPGLKIEVSPNGVPYRVFRGGAWESDNEIVVRTSFRGFNLPTYRAVGVGFRCVLVGK